MATRIVIVVDEDWRDNEALKVRVAAVAAKIGDGNREGKDHVTRYEVVAISDPGPPDPGHVVKIGSLRDGPTLRDALGAMVQELRAECAKIHVTSSSDENRGVAAGLYRAADMLDAILAAEVHADSLTMAQGAIDHYREGLYEILRADTGRSHREVAATYLGEGVPDPVPDPGKKHATATDLIDALAHLPRCVMGCGKVGVRYTTDTRYTACDDHANADARDLDYAPAVRALDAAICA